MILDFSDKAIYNEKYIPLLHDKKRYLFLQWWGGSGKSKFQAQKEIIETFEAGNRLLWVRKVKDTIKDSIFAELCGVIEDWDIGEHFTITSSPMRIINNLTGSDIIFRGLDDVEKIKSVSDVTRVWLEEATEADKKDFDQLDIRLRWFGKALQITCTYNPVSDQNWLITDFWNLGETDDVTLVHSTFRDNRFVGQETYEKVFERLKIQDINLYNIYALGIPGKAVEGLIYTYENIASVPEEAKRLGYGLDFGYNHPACLVGLYEWNDGIIIDEEFHKNGMINGDIVAYVKENWISETDDIIADNSRPEAIEEICRGGFNCKPCKKWPDSVINGVFSMKGMKLYITARSSWIKKDFDNYVWAKDKNGKPIDTPIKAFDDWPDAVRYGLSYYFDFGEFDITFG